MMQYRAGEIAAYLEIGRALRRGGCRCKAPLTVTKTLMDELAGRMTQDEFFVLAIRLTTGSGASTSGGWAEESRPHLPQCEHVV